jgi:hypothetical protein
LQVNKNRDVYDVLLTEDIIMGDRKINIEYIINGISIAGFNIIEDTQKQRNNYELSNNVINNK